MDETGTKRVGIGMHKELEAFFIKPTCERYHVAREAVVSDSAFRVDYGDMLRLTSLVQAGRMSEAQVELDMFLPSWALSPRIHSLGSTLARHFHDRDDAELFRFMEQACLEGLRGSGQGSLDEPYCALYPTDPVDMLRELGQTPLTQSVHRGGGDRGNDVMLDVFHCESGAEIAFSTAIVSTGLGATGLGATGLGATGLGATGYARPVGRVFNLS